MSADLTPEARNQRIKEFLQILPLTFEIAGLPPGERYLATALEFFEDGDEQDPEVLERLRANATPFTIGEGERMTLDLRARER